MSPNGDISNKRQNKEHPNKELNPWLQRLADRARPFTARPITPASIPSLGSYIRQQMGLMGESNSRLARWVIDHSRLASVISRASQLPLLARAFDTVGRTPILVSPVWQRMLDLPWFRWSREQRRSSTATTGTAPDGKLTNTVSLQNERYPNTFIQAIRDTEEERPGDEAGETYPLAAIASDLPQAAPAGNLPVQKKDTADTRHSKELAQGPGIIRKVPPVYTADEAYPAVIQNLFPLSEAGERLPDIARATSATLMTGRVAVGLETQGIDSLTSSLVSQSGIAMPGLAKSSDIQRPRPGQVKDAQERTAKVDRPPYHIYHDRSLTRFLTPMTQRTTLQRKLVEANPFITAENVREGQASPVRDFYYPKAIDRGEEPGSVIPGQAALPLINSIPGAYAGPGQPAMIETATGLDETVSNLLPTREVTPGEVSRALPYRAAPQRELGAGPTQTGKTVISRQTKGVTQEAEVTHKSAEDVLNVDLLVAGVGGSVDKGLTEGHAEKRLLYKETPATAGPAIQPQPIIKSISRKITLPYQRLFKSAANAYPSGKSKSDRLLVNREYGPSSPEYDYAQKTVLPLPVVSSPRPQADFSVARSEGLLRQTPYTVHELTYSRNNGTNTAGILQRAPEPTTSAVETNERPQVTAPGPGGDEIGEQQGATPDLRALAREIYPLIKRMIMVERERRPT